ncbi:unnamed protein product [Mucor hiemalis]
MTTGSWITVFDNLADSAILFASDGITATTGWTKEELCAKQGYEVVHPEDQESVRKLHMSNVMNEIVHMCTFRYSCKDGGFVRVEVVTHYCFDVIVTCAFLHDKDSIGHKSRANTVDEVYHCLPKGVLLCDVARDQRIKYNLTKDELWRDNNVGKNDQELRFCIILSRETHDLNVMYASKATKDLVSMDPENFIGQSFYDFVEETDIASVRSQINLTMQHNMATKLRFHWILNKMNGSIKAVEAVASCADDGVVMVIRLAPTRITTI